MLKASLMLNFWPWLHITIDLGLVKLWPHPQGFGVSLKFNTFNHGTHSVALAMEIIL